MSEKPEWIEQAIWDRIDSLSDDILVARVGPPHLRDFHLKVLFAQEVARAVKQEREECAVEAYNVPHYTIGADFGNTDENGQLRPGSPYDAGRYDAAKAIRSRSK